MWAREFGKKAGVNVPLHAAEHFYVVTEKMEGLQDNLPTMRDMDGYCYYKPEGGHLLVGMFEPGAKPWGMDGISEDFSFDQIPDDFDHLEPYLECAMHRVPQFGETGLKLFFNGPESFTPDDSFQLGEAPELKNYFVAAGFNSVGIQSAGGAGKMLSEWIHKGHAPQDLWGVDIKRNMPFQGTQRYLQERTTETLGLLYETHYPFKQFRTSRGVRRSVLHNQLEALGAVFGTESGWERANWFAPEGVEAARLHLLLHRLRAPLLVRLCRQPLFVARFAGRRLPLRGRVAARHQLQRQRLLWRWRLDLLIMRERRVQRFRSRDVLRLPRR